MTFTKHRPCLCMSTIHHVSDSTSKIVQSRSCFICDVTHPGDNYNNNTWSNSRSCKQAQCAQTSHVLSPRTDGSMLLKTEAAAYKPRQNTHRLLLLGFIQMTLSFHRPRELTMCWFCRTPDPANRPPYAYQPYEYHYFDHLARSKPKSSDLERQQEHIQYTFAWKAWV